MNTLPEKLRKNGMDYTLVGREGNRAIYRQQVAENLQYWEVFKVKIKPAAMFKGKLIPEREVFPYDEDFGNTAWTCRTLGEAMKRFKEL